METERRANWPELAEKLARRFPGSKFHRSVLRWIESNPGKDPVGIAFSGGADSLSLLLLLRQHFPDWRNRLHVLHFDHKLRGSERSEERRVGKECRHRGAATAES